MEAYLLVFTHLFLAGPGTNLSVFFLNSPFPLYLCVPDLVSSVSTIGKASRSVSQSNRT